MIKLSLAFMITQGLPQMPLQPSAVLFADKAQLICKHYCGRHCASMDDPCILFILLKLMKNDFWSTQYILAFLTKESYFVTIP